MPVRQPAPLAPPIVDVAFPMLGTTLPADHGWALYSAICRAVPALHGDERLAIAPIAGLPSVNRTLSLPRNARLRLRVPGDAVAAVLPLAGKTLLVDGASLVVGVPSVRLLAPSPSLHSRLVIISPYTEPEPFLEAASRQMAELGVVGRLSLERTRASVALERRSGRPVGAPIRRTLRIHGRTIVGFAVQADGLSDADSLALQASGLGGRRRFGCGVFVPPPPAP